MFQEGVGTAVSRGNAFRGLTEKGICETGPFPVKIVDTPSERPNTFGEVSVDGPIFELKRAFQDCTCSEDSGLKLTQYETLGGLKPQHKDGPPERVIRLVCSQLAA
jgi:hypothetical protein